KIGMFMRKTRLDEIPQLWNILRGDMDFVGPRPERPEFIPMLSENLPFYYLRHLIRPGLTGWAQIRYGYGATLAETKEKLEYDLYYLKHMSLGLDLFVMFETIKTIIRYTYAGYPLAIALLARLHPRPWRKEPWPADGPAPISIIMAVHNGAAMLPTQIAYLTALDPHLVHEIIIVSDGSTDSTPEILEGAAAPRLKPIIVREHGGKASALNHGIAAVTAEIILFVDIR